MSDQTNAAVARRAYQAFSDGDFDALSEVLSAEVVWNVSGENPIAGTYKGRDATFELFREVGELTNGSYRVEPETVDSEGDQVVVRHLAAGQRAGKRLDTRSTLRITMSNGQIVEANETPDDDSAWNDFWS
jgi:hypothetical protein